MLIALLQTNWSRSLMIGLVEKHSPNWLNGRVHIGDIRGSLLGDIVIQNLVLKQENDTVLTVGEVAAFFRIAPLFRGRMVVDSFRIANGYLHLNNDSVLGLNIARLIPPSLPDDTPPSPSKISLSIGQLIIDPLTIRLTGFNDPLPRKVDSIRIYSQLELDGLSFKFYLDSLSATPAKPWPKLELLKFGLKQSPQGITISEFCMRTSQNRAEGQAFYKSTSFFDTRMGMHQPTIHEFSFLLPDLAFAPLDTIFLNADNRSGHLFFDAAIRRGQQQISLKGDISSFDSIFSASHMATPFNTMVTLHNVRVAEWMPSLPEGLLLNGSLSAQGNYPMLTSHPIHLNGNFSGSKWEGIEPSLLVLKSSFSERRASLSMDIQWEEQTIKSQMDVAEWLTKPRFTGQVQLKGLDAIRFPGHQPMRLEHGQLVFNGEGDGLQSLKGQCKLQLQQIEAYGIPVDSLLVQLHIDKGMIVMDTLLLTMPGNVVHASGNYRLDNELVALAIAAKLHNFKLNDQRVPIKLNVLNGHLEAMVEGNVRQPKAKGVMELNHILIDSMTIENLAVQMNGQWMPDLPSATLNMTVKNFIISNNKANEIRLAAHYTNRMAKMEVHALLADSIHFNIASKATIGDTLQVQIPDIHLSMGRIGVDCPDTLQLRWSGTTLWIDRMELVQRHKQGNRLWMQGVINPLGSSDLQLTLDHFHLETIQPFFNFELPKATCSMALHLTGEPNAHHLYLKSQIDSLRYGQLMIHRITQNGLLTNQTLNLETRIMNQAGEHLPVVLKSSHLLRQDSLLFHMTNKPVLTMESGAENLPLLKVVPPMKNMQVLGGLLSYHLLVSGELSNPQVNGYIRVGEAAFKVPTAGIDFSDFEVGIRAMGSSLLMDSLKIQTGKGSLNMKGGVTFESGVLSPMQAFNMSLLADGFRLRRRNYFDFTFNANANIQTVDQVPIFDGRLDILNAQINMDKLMSQSRPRTYREDALLVSALKNMKGELAQGDEDDDEDVTGISSHLNFAGFKGRLKLVIPRNTWLKGDNMGIEILGDLDVVKEGDDFELFGNLGVNRGFYSLYGRKLNIVKGDLIFQGGTTIDPTLNLEAQYVFRTPERQKKTLQALVGGKLSQPDINFELNGESIPQGDAIGYLVFGKPMSELGVSSQQAVGNASAGDAVSGLLTSELSRLLGNKLNLDVFEIDATDNWESASFVVGKYITNNLFVIYQRAFGKATDNDIAPETVTLEYELNRHLFFRLESGDEKSSGVDLILKVESKNK